MPNQKGFAPVLIIILLAAVTLAGGFFVYTNYSNNRTKVDKTQQTQSTPAPQKTENIATNSADITNWKIYSNNVLGYSFSYPEFLKLVEVGYKRGEIVVLTGGSGEQIQIDAMTEATISLDQWIKDLDSTKGIEILSTNNKLINGSAAVQRHERKEGAGGEKYEEEKVYLVAKNHLINISSTRAESTLKALDTILSTFKFLP